MNLLGSTTVKGGEAERVCKQLREVQCARKKLTGVGPSADSCQHHKSYPTRHSPLGWNVSDQQFS